MSFEDIASSVLGIGGAAASGPKINAPRFQGVSTPSLSLSPGGALSRTNQLVPQTEGNLLAFSGANRLGLQAAGQGQLANIGNLRREIPGLQQRAAGFFDRTGAASGVLQQNLEQLRPGFGRLTESRVQGVRGAASKATGNLRTSFEKRNIAGSSFANQQISQIQETFAQEEDRVRAESFIQEQQAQQQIIQDIGGLLQLDQGTLQQQAGLIGLQLGLNQAESGVFANNLAAIQSENAVLQGRISRELQELGISGSIITQVQAIASQVAIAQAKLEAENAKNAGAGLIDAGFGLDNIFDFAAPFFGGTAANAGGAASGAAGTNLFSGAATSGGAAGFALPFSDRRVKRDIRRVGQLDNGLTVYAYRLKSGGPTQIGVMAQEVEAVNTHAVVEIDGLKHVNYDLAVS